MAWRAFAPALLWVAAATAPAAELAAAPAPAEPLVGYQHTAWTSKNGSPVDIWAMLQDDNGELVLGTGAGLFRFDGVRFRREPLPTGTRLASSNITAVHASAGELWIGYHSAGASVLRAGVLQHFRAGDDFPRGMVYGFARDGDDRLWVATDSGPAVFVDGAWQRPGPGWGLPGEHADWLLRGRDGRFWVAAGDRIFMLAPGRTRYTDTGIATDRHAVLEEDGRGRIWASDPLYGTRVIAGADAEHVPPAIPLFARRLRATPDGALWLTDGRNGGLRRIDADGHVQAYSRADGLSSDMAVPLLYDREGNLWIGTNLGLNRLRRQHVAMVRELTGTTYAYFAAFIAGDGRARLVNDGRLWEAGRDGLRVVADGLPLATSAVTDPGGAWLLGPDGLQRWHEDGRHIAVPLPEGLTGAGVQAMAATGDGELWIVPGGDGVYRGGALGWRREPVPVAAGTPNVLAADGAGGLWLGFQDSRIAHLRDGAWQEFTAGDGLQVGNVTALHVEDGELLVAGEDGLAMSSGKRFRSLAPAQADKFTNITGMLRGHDGAWWFNGTSGLLRVDPAALDAALADPARLPDVRVFDDQDGLDGVALQARSAPTLSIDSDGVLWIASNQGVGHVDPARIERNPLPPPVTIQRVSTEAGDVAAVDGMVLGEGTTQLRIDYTAASLTVPERVRFRYLLEGADAIWQDVGARREAFYTNLGPGDYRFHVIAANNDGVWNNQGATLAFSIRPTFVQGRAFVVACVLAGLFLLVLAQRLHLRRTSQRLRERLEERHREREHIARDLHDTLLQGFQGLLLRFQAVAGHLQEQSAERRQLELALDSAEQALEEGRDRVSGLRGDLLGEQQLCDALGMLGCEYAADTGAPKFEVLFTGERRPLRDGVRDELYLIAREAMVNAFRHSGAREVRLELSCLDSGLALRIIDDGQGLPPEVAAAGRRVGHWGLTGMRERAQRLGASLTIGPGVEGGTIVEIRLPAKRALRDHRASGWERLRSLWPEKI